jgi:hypothetical protein
VLKIQHAGGRIRLSLRVDRAPFKEPMFELAQHLRVAVARNGRAIDHLRVLVRQLVKAVFDGLKAFLPLVPEVQRQAEPVDLRLQLRQASLEIGNVL